MKCTKIVWKFWYKFRKKSGSRHWNSSLKLFLRTFVVIRICVAVSSERPQPARSRINLYRNHGGMSWRRNVLRQHFWFKTLLKMVLSFVVVLSLREKTFEFVYFSLLGDRLGGRPRFRLGGEESGSLTTSVSLSKFLRRRNVWRNLWWNVLRHWRRTAFNCFCCPVTWNEVFLAPMRNVWRNWWWRRISSHFRFKKIYPTGEIGGVWRNWWWNVLRHWRIISSQLILSNWFIQLILIEFADW